MCIIAAWKMLVSEARMKNPFGGEEAVGLALEGSLACFETRWN
jgi:hypothetical protein